MRQIFPFLAAILLAGCAGDGRTFDLQIGTAEFAVELANTVESRATGLMYREELAESTGMLFVFDREEPRSFYMKNTLIPLSIAYIDRALVIREIHDMEPLSLEPVDSRYPAMYALEVNQGAFERNGVRVGQKLIPSDDLARAIGLR